MTAKEYLSQAKCLRIEIAQREKEIEEIKARAMGGGSLCAEGDRVQTSIYEGSRLEENVTRYVDLTDKIEADIWSYYEKRNEIIDTIHELNDSRYILILYAKWIDEESLERIAADIGYSFEYIKQLYWKAMRAIQTKIDKCFKK